MTLGMYYNGSDTVIAESVEDAKNVWKETTGDDWDLFVKNEDIDDEWEMKHKDVWSIIFEDLNDVTKIFQANEVYEIEKDDSGYYLVKATEQAWITNHGRGWFCSENW